MTQMTVEQLKERMAGENKPHLVDVREDAERVEFNIGGLHHKLGLIATMQTEPLDDWKDEEVIVYCRSGKRSLQACMILETMGFTNVVNLEGGILAWQEKFPG